MSMWSKPSGESRAASSARTHSRGEATQTFTRTLKERDVLLAGSDLDEGPIAYRRLPDLLLQHAGTVRVLHTWRPFAVAMAGRGEFDLFRD